MMSCVTGTLLEELAYTHSFMSEEDLLNCMMTEKNDAGEITTDEYSNLAPDHLNVFKLLVAIEVILN